MLLMGGDMLFEFILLMVGDLLCVGVTLLMGDGLWVVYGGCVNLWLKYTHYTTKYYIHITEAMFYKCIL